MNTGLSIVVGITIFAIILYYFSEQDLVKQAMHLKLKAIYAPLEERLSISLSYFCSLDKSLDLKKEIAALKVVHHTIHDPYLVIKQNNLLSLIYSKFEVTKPDKVIEIEDGLTIAIEEYNQFINSLSKGGFLIFSILRNKKELPFIYGFSEAGDTIGPVEEDQQISA